MCKIGRLWVNRESLLWDKILEFSVTVIGLNFAHFDYTSSMRGGHTGCHTTVWVAETTLRCMESAGVWNSQQTQGQALVMNTSEVDVDIKLGDVVGGLYGGYIQMKF